MLRLDSTLHIYGVVFHSHEWFFWFLSSLRGLRHADQLSSLLFVVVEALSRMMSVRGFLLYTSCVLGL